ncbi:MAG: hypothetical protein FJ147_18165 [Deltaproteobacteria bacterium]|nr:hypothetical protein [Deltaproteobacteria bacterium]
MLTFEQQDSAQTLAEGMAEYYERHPHLVRGQELSPAAQEFFRCHDTAHVVFGCNTSLPHEAVVKLSSVFGTTGGFSILKGYRLHESINIYRQLTLRDIAITVLQSGLLVPLTISRCLRQHKRWPWAQFTEYQDVPLGRLRAEFGIRVAGALVSDRQNNERLYHP